MVINFLQPWFLLLAVPAALLLWFYNGSLRFRRESLSLVRAARVLFFLLLILCLARPHLVSTFTGQTVIYLVDRSRSTAAAPDHTAWINESLASRGPEDQAAVVAFGRDTQLLKPFAMERLSGGGAVDDGYTGIERALQAAYSLIPADTNGRIVLISDGLENIGDSLSYAAVLAARGIPVDVAPIAVETGDEVALLDISLPKNSFPGQQIFVEVELQSTVNTTGVLSLFWEGSPFFSDSVSLTAGVQRFSIPVEVTGRGLQRVQVIIEPARDTLLQNNSINGLTNVQAPPRVLIAEGAAGKGIPLHHILLEQGIDAHITPAFQLPASLTALAGYQAVYLVDVPAYALTENQLDNLDLFVRFLGGGVTVIGGKNSFGMGLYQDTPLERLLPVTMEVESEEDLPGLDMVLVIDRSGSMQGEKLNMAKNASIVALDTLKERDRLAVLTFDDRYYIDLPLTGISEKEAITEAITAITVGGGTIIHPALVEAVNMLEGSTKSKHIVLLSDGMEGTQFNYAPLLDRIVEQGVSLSTIALGEDADTRHMQFLAENTDGRFYFVPHCADLPSIFLQETILAGGDYLVEEQFFPSITHSFVRHFNGTTPLFHGYIAATPKPLSEVLMLTHRDHPLLSRWQYGLGRTIAFTSDSWGMWSPEFVQHRGFPDFWADILAWIVPQHGTGGMALDVRLEDGGAVITALLEEPLGEGESLTVTVVDEAAAQHELALRPAGGGRYSARLDRISEGVYLLSASRLGDENVTGQAMSGFAVPYPPEFRIPAGSGAELLASLSSRTGGRLLSSPQAVFAAPPQPVKRATDITYWLLLAAAVLWPLDIAVRRFGIALTTPAKQKKKTAPPPAAAQPQAESTLERLLAARQKKGS